MNMQSNKDFDVPTYLNWCQKFDLVPCSPSEFLAGLKFAKPNELPYRNQNDLVWLHDIDNEGVCRTLVDAIFGKAGKLM